MTKRVDRDNLEKPEELENAERRKALAAIQKYSLFALGTSTVVVSASHALANGKPVSCIPSDNCGDDGGGGPENSSLTTDSSTTLPTDTSPMEW